MMVNYIVCLLSLVRMSEWMNEYPLVKSDQYLKAVKLLERSCLLVYDKSFLSKI